MFYHDHGIPKIPQVLQRIQQLVIVPLMQPYTGLVQNIADSYQSRTNLGSQADALRFTSGQRSSRPGQRQILQSHIHQKADSGAYLLQQLFSDQKLLAGKLHLLQKVI